MLIIKKISNYTLFLGPMLIPYFSRAAIVTCGNPSLGQPDCDFNSAVGLINNAINFIIVSAVVIFTISCVYGGFLWILSGDIPANKTKAKNVLWNTLYGFVIILVSWLIVHTILITLVDRPEGNDIFRFIGG